LIFLLFGHIKVHREQGAGTIREIGLSQLGLILPGTGGAWGVAIVIYSGYLTHESDEVAVVELMFIAYRVPEPSSAWIPSPGSGTLVSGG
jgi:hypothetical protein